MSDISIKVNIGNRMYPLRIKATEEEIVRKAAKLLHEKMAFFNKSFSVKDNIDGLAMAALEFAVDNVNQSNKQGPVGEKPVDLEPLNQKLAEIEALLSEKS